MRHGSECSFHPPVSDEAFLHLYKHLSEQSISPSGLVEVIEFVASEGPGTACLLFATTEQAAASLRFNGFVALGIAM